MNIKNYLLMNYLIKWIKPFWAKKVIGRINKWQYYNFKNIDSAPSEIKGFYDLMYLFNPQTTQRYIRMDINEGAYLWKLIKENNLKTVLEVGRHIGGCTVLLASTGAKVISVDIKSALSGYLGDLWLEKHLKGLGLECKLVISNSSKYDPECELDLVVLDGDHSYEGVKADFENYDKYLKVGGHMLFHNSAPKYLTAPKEGSMRLMKEIRGYDKVKIVGSFTHWKKIGKEWYYTPDVRRDYEGR